ncbi:MAG: phosphoesterase [Bryobacterales bacterium]|nr:phosphoesterase [Bryobacterales bacterium]
MHRLLLPLLANALLSAQTPDRPVRSVTDPGVVTTRQSIAPAGVPAIFQGKVYGLSFGSSASDLWVLGATHVYHVDWRENRAIHSVPHGGTPGLLGIAFAQSPLVAAVPRGGKAGLFQFIDGALKPLVTGLGANNAGGVAAGGGIALVPLIFENKAAVIDVEKGKLLGMVETGIAPFAAAVNAAGTIGYVSNWGGRRPRPKDLTAPAGVGKDADQVVVDARGIASTGSVTRIDLKALRTTHTIAVGLHPNGLAWDEARRRLYTANNNQDSVTVIDTQSNTVLRTIKIQPFQREVTGVAPTAVAVSKDGARLFVTCGGINAVAVLDPALGRLEGLIPTGWYPNAIAVSPDGKQLAVGSMLGAGSGWRDEPKKRFVHAYRGSVNVVEIPSPSQLASYTTAVSENNHLPLAGTPVKPAVAAGGALAVPVRAGDPSLIEHVVYVVKENRTYDQLFGDLAKGNGEPDFVLFGESVTPNQRKLARDFVLLDNFYATGGNSADGHQWVTQANEVAYTLWPGYQGRSYPFDGTDPIGIARGGTIWDAAVKLGKTVRIYGEYAGRLSLPVAQRLGFLRRWRDGEDFSKIFNTTAPIASMNKYLARNFPAYATSVPDVVRAQIFLKDLKGWEAEGKMPNMTVVQLPSDHTFGASPGVSSAKAMVADNDLAVGLVVEALTKSKFWPKMAIYIVEDDAQNGVDHVDGHRTVALAVSPYIKRGHVDSTFYSHQSMLKTMELQLGLPTLSLFDLIAHDMRASFSAAPDLTPYSHVTPEQDLFELNPPASALRGPARKAALASAKMRWDVPDAAPSGALNKILWHSVKGWRTPYPAPRNAVFSPYSLDVDDDDR